MPRNNRCRALLKRAKRRDDRGLRRARAADPPGGSRTPVLPGLMIESRDRREVRLQPLQGRQAHRRGGESGIVHIEIRYVDGINVALSARLQEVPAPARRRRHAERRPATETVAGGGRVARTSRRSSTGGGSRRSSRRSRGSAQRIMPGWWAWPIDRSGLVADRAATPACRRRRAGRDGAQTGPCRASSGCGTYSCCCQAAARDDEPYAAWPGTVAQRSSPAASATGADGARGRRCSSTACTEWYRSGRPGHTVPAGRFSPSSSCCHEPSSRTR